MSISAVLDILLRLWDNDIFPGQAIKEIERLKSENTKEHKEGYSKYNCESVDISIVHGYSTIEISNVYLQLEIAHDITETPEGLRKCMNSVIHGTFTGKIPESSLNYSQPIKNINMESKMNTKSDAEWRKEDDARTLAEAERIKSDRSRFTGAKIAAKKLANERQKEASSLTKVAKQTTPRSSAKPRNTSKNKK